MYQYKQVWVLLYLLSTRSSWLNLHYLRPNLWLISHSVQESISISTMLRGHPRTRICVGIIKSSNRDMMFRGIRGIRGIRI